MKRMDVMREVKARNKVFFSKNSIIALCRLLILIIGCFLGYTLYIKWEQTSKNYIMNETMDMNTQLFHHYMIVTFVFSFISIGLLLLLYRIIMTNTDIISSHETERLSSTTYSHNNRLKLILDKTPQAIFEVDKKGICTFCNASCLKLLGYKKEEDLLGENIHSIIHHTNKDGTFITMENCNIYCALKHGIGTSVDDDIFWKADGSSFVVEYHSYPQIIDGEIVGAVVTFIDNSDRKRNEEHIRYLSYHDSLTGLYNRMFFDEELKRLDTKKNLPLSVIFADANGLKLTNDIFGHAVGDALLKRSASVLKSICREDDIIARIGGDEFAILLPKTDEIVARKITERIKSQLSKQHIVAINCSMSIGYDVKTNVEQEIERIMMNAENFMYKDKTIHREKINSDMVHSVISTLHHKFPQEKQHSMVVSDLCQKIGQAMNLSEADVKKLKDAGYLHDIGKIAVDESILKRYNDARNEEEKNEIKQHSIIGFRILNLSPNTMDLSEIVFSHHERWDGSGYPKGQKGEEIPKLARIIAIAESYDAMTNVQNKNAVSKEEALIELKNQAGYKFDPAIIDIFIKLVKNNEI